MAQISKVYIKEKAECITLTMRKTIDFMKEYSDFVEEVVEILEQYAEQKNILFSSGLMTCFHNMELEALDVEIGWEIPKEIEESGNIKVNRISATKIITAIDQGPYEKQDPTLEALFSFLNDMQMVMKGPIYYYYLNGIEQKPEAYLTEMMIPIL
ncbi:effector-binding domain-containing protein [Breznakia sp. PF5-3]|uniref:GyrI-like domain-containing protein n=1 Tax=unclassified Breznakia TaxID=2623764 RepID=UPI002406D0B0|nr:MULTISPECIES: GyrI-like domain-containing protein [unclassified Breznakia]MDF9824300.1 effector-binding domain-containing protein [Breznakia sp. PM6-1]MDF9835524.1 effector-binding domain-containing protein [Breznakia sp. PF5-3]MDF9838791.1 effector-binding domain-containing protein [Breznakia sp. PFB2-8]MDF9860821.1 effector-binding domain-containing protein [Breznakia sp. PH5-24]